MTRGQKKPYVVASSKHGLATGDEDIHSAVPSRMKRKIYVSINTEGSLKVKRQNVVFTRPKNNEPEDEVDVVSCGHVTIKEASNYETSKEEAKATPLSPEDGVNQRLNELKELSLSTIKDPRPTFISLQLSHDDENEYVSLLKAYKDVFTWSYKEMLGIDPKVVVHHLAIKAKHQPVKQA